MKPTHLEALFKIFVLLQEQTIVNDDLWGGNAKIQNAIVYSLSRLGMAKQKKASILGWTRIPITGTDSYYSLPNYVQIEVKHLNLRLNAFCRVTCWLLPPTLVKSDAVTLPISNTIEVK